MVHEGEGHKGRGIKGKPAGFREAYLNKIIRLFYNMGKKILLSILILTLFVNIGLVSACRDADAEFTVKIKTDIYLESISPYCTEQTCIQGDFHIVLKSQYDERVAVIIGDNLENFGKEFEGIMIKLPYDLEDGLPDSPEISSINPYEFNWEECAKTDLTFLKDVGVINLTSEELNTISELSDSGKNIQLCEEGWESFNYFFACSEDLENCEGDACLLPTCIGAAFPVILPAYRLGEEPCTENWECSEWSDCVDNQQTRSCSDLNNCGTEENKPATSQSCSVQEEDTGNIFNFYYLAGGIIIIVLIAAVIIFLKGK
jgi:hypothetical protein